MKKFFSRLAGVFNPCSIIGAGLGLLGWLIWGGATQPEIKILLNQSTSSFLQLFISIPSWTWPISGFMTGIFIRQLAKTIAVALHTRKKQLAHLSPREQKRELEEKEFTIKLSFFAIIMFSVSFIIIGSYGLYASLSLSLIMLSSYFCFFFCKFKRKLFKYYFQELIFLELLTIAVCSFSFAPTLMPLILPMSTASFLLLFKCNLRQFLPPKIKHSGLSPLEKAVFELNEKKNSLAEYKDKIIGQDTIFGELIKDADKQLTDYDKIIRYYKGLVEKTEQEEEICHRASAGKAMIASYKKELDGKRQQILEFLNQIEVGIEREIGETTAMVSREKMNLDHIDLLRQLNVAVDDLNLKTKDYLESKLLGALKALDGFMDTVRDKNIIEEARRIIAGEMETKLQPQPSLSSENFHYLAINTEAALGVINDKLEEIKDLTPKNEFSTSNN